MEFPDVTVVVIAHDAGDALGATLERLVELGRFGELHLVDSGSTDGSIERVAPRFPEVRLTRLPGNPGPCVSRNRGWREARTPFVLFTDDDMRLDEGCVPRLLEELRRDPRRALAGPRIFHDGSSERVQYEGGTWHYAGLTHLRGQSGEPLGAEPVEVDVLTSGCLLARREALEESGGFDESLFFLMEDVDLALRLRYLGWRLCAVPAAHAWNAGGSEGLSLRPGRYPADRVRYHSRNRVLLVLGLYDLWTLLVLAPGIVLLDLAWFVFSLGMGRAGAFVRGKLEIPARLGAVRQKRRALRGRKRLTDRDLLGAPPLTLTPTAQEKPLVRTLTSALDHVLRLYWRLVRWLIR